MKDEILEMPGQSAAVESNSSPRFRSTKSVQLYNAYDEYFERLEKGEEIDPDEYCAQHPHLRSALAKVLQLHSFLEQNDELASTFAYPRVGTSFLHFNLLDELGEGAFAKVFLAYDTVLGRRAALKLSRRAKAEAKIMGPIEHNNIALVHYIAEDKESGLTAICMPYRGSATLDDVLCEIQALGSMPAEAAVILEAVRYLPMPLDAGANLGAPNPILQEGAYVAGIRLIGAQIADALAYLHVHDICHCDLKPSNILMTPNGTPMLLDFNLSTDLQTDSAAFGGTLPYMAPEVLAALAAHELPAPTVAVGARADIYSFGVILYQLVTGKHPLGLFSLKLKTSELRDQLLARQKLGVRPAHEVNPQVDHPLSDLIQRCLALDPAQRPETARSLAENLQPTPPPSELETKPAVRRRSLVFAGILLCACFLAGPSVVSVLRAPIGKEAVADPLQLAEASYRQGDYPETIKRCDQARFANPELQGAIFLSARSKQKMGLYDSAISDYAMLDHKLGDGRYKSSIGYCFNCLERHENAFAIYRDDVKSEFINAEVNNNIGFTLMKIGKTPDKLQAAVASLDRAIEMNRKLAVPYYNRGLIATNLAIRNRNQKKANINGGAPANLMIVKGILDFQTAIALGDDSAGIYFDAAVLCAIAADTDGPRADDAIKYLRLSLERGQNPQSVNHPSFTSMRLVIAKANLDKVAVLVNKSTPTLRILDPIVE